jgi:hypothetical protein
MPKFEIAIHNAEVRRMQREGMKHRNLSDSWGETHYMEIDAPTEREARARITRKYPPDKGFVIEDVIPVHIDE